MSQRGYDIANDFMCFKTGAYHENNSAGDQPDDFAQVTFYPSFSYPQLAIQLWLLARIWLAAQISGHTNYFML